MRETAEIIAFDFAREVALARQGDKQAEENLYYGTYQKAYAVAYSFKLDSMEAEDILQISYLKAFQKLSQLEKPESFDKWLCQIVRNACRDYKKKEKPILQSQMEDEDSAPIDFEDEDTGAQPEEVIDKQETSRLFKEFLQALPEAQRQVVVMYYYQRMSVREIADELECSEDTVKSRLRYSLPKIKNEVLALEKKGTKLYGVAPIPFFLWVLRNSGVENGLSPQAASGILQAVQLELAKAAGGAAASAASAAAGKAAAGTAATAAKGAAGIGIGAKIVAGVAALAVAIGTGAAIANAISPKTDMADALPVASGFSINSITKDSSDNSSSAIVYQESFLTNADDLSDEIIDAAQRDALAVVTTQMDDKPEYYPMMIWILNSIDYDNIKEGKVSFSSPELVQTYFYTIKSENAYREFENCLYFTYKISVVWPDEHISEMFISVRVPDIIRHEDGSLTYNKEKIEDDLQESSLEKMQKVLSDFYDKKYEKTIL